MLVRPKDFLCCAGWDLVCPGTSKVTKLDRNEGTKMHLTKLFFFCFYLSYPYLFFHFYRSYHLPTFSFLKLQPIRAIIVMCDGNVYHIDVDAVAPMKLEPVVPRSRVKHSTTEPLRSHQPS